MASRRMWRKKKRHPKCLENDLTDYKSGKAALCYSETLFFFFSKDSVSIYYSIDDGSTSVIHNHRVTVVQHDLADALVHDQIHPLLWSFVGLASLQNQIYTE